MDLPRLIDCAEVAPPRHATALLQSLPPFTPRPAGVAGVVDLASTLGFVETAVPEPSFRWPPLHEECLEKPHDDLVCEAGRVLSTDVVAQLDVVASRWEAKVRDREEVRRCCDWSFQKTLYRPCAAMIEALKREEVSQS